MHIKSLKTFLIITISTTLVITSFVSTLWIYKTTNNNIANLFDILLVDDANHLGVFLENIINDNKTINEIQSHLIIHSMNESFIKKQKKRPSVKLKKAEISWAEHYTENFESEVIFQVWTIHPNKLIVHSAYAPIEKFANFNSGFSTSVYNKEKYRVYTQVIDEYNLIIQTAQKYKMRNELGYGLLKQQLYPMLIITPLLFFLIFFAIKLAADNIRHITDNIKKRDPKNLNLLEIKNTPNEILPLIQEINRLFGLINANFAREQRFNSDAAHELKTPLAGIKTQAEVAIKILNALLDQENNSNTEKINNINQIIHNLTNITNSISRSDHVISQLLILSRLSLDQPLENIEDCYLDKITRELIADLCNHAADKNIDISLEIKPVPPVLITPTELSRKSHIPVIQGNKILLTILIRNLIDNAIKYSGENSKVNIKIISKKSHVTLEVTDNGPGLSDELKKRIFDRFYRVPGTVPAGSGLGLSIVQLIADLHHAIINVSNNTKLLHGLVFKINFPKKH